MRNFYLLAFVAMSVMACNNQASPTKEGETTTSTSPTSAETKKPAGLPSGKFQSTEDPLAVIEFKDGRFIETNDGEVLVDFPYDYDPTCENCKSQFQEGTSAGEKHKGCFKYVDTDETYAYIIYTLSNDIIEYSMIGGRGNTLSYKRIK